MNNLGFHCHGLGDFDKAIVTNGLKRGEFYNFPTVDLPELREMIVQHELATSIHSPLERMPWYHSPPTYTFLCDMDEKKRDISLKMIEDTMKKAQEFEVDYVVVHFPTPKSRDSDGATYDELFQIAWQSAGALAEMAETYETDIHIEGFGPSPFLNTYFIEKVITEFPSLRYCFDVGHMHIAADQFGFDFYEFTKDMAPYVGSVHLWNTRGMDDYLAYRHIPVHPSQDSQEGWGNIPRVLQLLLAENPSCSIILESSLQYPRELGGYDIREGVEWVKGIIDDLS